MTGQDLPLFEHAEDGKGNLPVECLGMTFENDEARRAYFLNKLREKLKDPEFRKTEGFPIGEDEDILALSDPPYYTACPNPFMKDFIQHYGKPYDPETDDYKREPFAADVSEGKNDPIYNAHSYHTKVPHKAIMRYILHYTEPGDVVFDGFCGTGMTGVAAQLCGDRATVESLGYKIQKDGTILDEESQPFSKLGVRRAILNDLSTAASFIAYNYNTSVDAMMFEREARHILAEVKEECGWMYLTLHQPMPDQIEKAILLLGNPNSGLEAQNSELIWGEINYVIWSDVFSCPECAGEVILWVVAVDKIAKVVYEVFPCPHCSAELSKRNMEHAWTTKFDQAINQTVKQAKQVPVLINYSIGKKRLEKIPDAFDSAIIDKIENSFIFCWLPVDRMPKGDEARRNDRSGITHLHHFYTKRNLWLLAAVRSRSKSRPLKFWVNAADRYLSKMSKIGTTYYLHGGGGAVNAGLLGTLYIPSFSVENSVLETLLTRLPKLARVFDSIKVKTNQALTACQSSSNLFLQTDCLDYIFLDPPFGANIMYSELNFLWESWLKILTNQELEAIENKTQGKGLDDYRHLMTDCFKEAYRTLKPGRWMTVEFSNTQAKVWNAIQTALQEAGFVVANVSALDKKQGSFKAVNTTTAVKQDLVISAYKPSRTLEACISENPDVGVWEFIHDHLRNLPSVKGKRGELEFISERDPRILYDRLVAYYVLHSYDVPLSSQDFQAGLTQRFAERDGMIFLLEQVAEYDRKRLTIAQAPQLDLFVFDERTSIDWLLNLLKHRPSTYQEIQPEFMQQLSASWRKYETRPELSELLKTNFLCYDGKGDVPSQIHSYLSSNYKDMRNLSKDSPMLVAKAKERWYVPDPNKAGDLEKLRERELLRQFETYQQAKQKQLKEFRLEALRAGFKKAWQERNYQTIVDIGRKIPEATLQEDEKLLMYYDQSVTRVGEDD